MLPNELRERSRRYRQAAGQADAPTKRQLAAHAAVLAQVAEAVERMIAGGAGWGEEGAEAEQIRRNQSLIVEALDERVQQLVRTLLRDSPADDQRLSPADDRQRERIRAWRRRAEELRAIADQFVVPSAQDALRRAAANCDRLADHAEAVMQGLGLRTEEKAG